MTARILTLTAQNWQKNSFYFYLTFQVNIIQQVTPSSNNNNNSNNKNNNK